MNLQTNAALCHLEFDDLVECTELLQKNDKWNEKIKEALHMDLLSITTADGLVDLKDGKKLT